MSGFTLCCAFMGLGGSSSYSELWHRETEKNPTTF